MTVQCSCDNCYNDAVAKGLCDMHYRRVKRHGHTHQTRPNDWGKKEKHPLYNSWGWIRKMRGRHQIQTEWDDFWKFVEDVGDRPSEKHRLAKIKEELGYTKGNLIWKEHISSTEDRNKYARDWRKANPEKVKNSELKKMFGITLEEYNSLRESQGYSCAICGKSEEDTHSDLAVDHCHVSGKIRGLLCASCNMALGLLKDDKQLLQSAIKYLGV